MLHVHLVLLSHDTLRHVMIVYPKSLHAYLSHCSLLDWYTSVWDFLSMFGLFMDRYVARCQLTRVYSAQFQLGAAQRLHSQLGSAQLTLHQLVSAPRHSTQLNFSSTSWTPAEVSYSSWKLSYKCRGVLRVKGSPMDVYKARRTCGPCAAQWTLHQPIFGVKKAPCAALHAPWSSLAAPHQQPKACALQPTPVCAPAHPGVRSSPPNAACAAPCPLLGARCTFNTC